MRTFLIARASVLALLAAHTLVACAGGGGGDAPPPTGMPASPPPPPPPPVNYPSTSSSEYLKNWAVADSKAITAWQNGASGQGIIVAVIDTGADGSDAELAGRISAASKDINTARNQLFDPSETHGSEIAAVIAANFNGAKTVGIAFNATILAIRADDGTGQFSSTDVIPAIDYAIAQGAKVLSLSFGGPTPSVSSMRAAIERATDAGIIVVASAGNDSASQPDYPAFLATDPTTSNNIIIAAGAHAANGSFASFSNQAGAAQNFYLTAPGVNVVVPDFGAPGPTDPAFQICASDGTCQVAGTSYSTPAVAAAIALLREAFPALTPQQVVNLLLQSADDTGTPPGIDSTWGRGRLDIDRAFQPVGTVSIPLTQSAAEITPFVTLGMAGAAFGDGISRQTSVWQAAGFDELGRAFMVDLSRNWIAPPDSNTIRAIPALWASAAAPERFAAAMSVGPAPGPDRPFEDYQAAFSPTSLHYDTIIGHGLTATYAINAQALPSVSPAETSGHLAFAGAENAFALTQSLGSRTSLSVINQGSITHLGLALAKSKRRALVMRLDTDRADFSGALTLGLVQERGSFLGLTWAEQLARPPESSASFVAAAGTWQPTARLRLGAEIELGQTRASGGTWLSLDKPLLTTAFAAGASFALDPDWLRTVLPDAAGLLRISVRQPLRVEAGTMLVRLPSANEWGRASLTYVTRSFNPEPSGREIDYEFGYEVWSRNSFALQASAVYRAEPGHVAAARPKAVGTVGLRYRF